MAYVLGFFAADGSMLENKRGACFIEFQVTDRQIIVDIRAVISSNHSITNRKRNTNQNSVYRLQIGSKEWFGDLTHLGFTQAKSKTLCFPCVPPRYVGSFVRGYFDGDGGVYFRKYKVKDRKKPRWVFSSKFTSGSREFLCVLHNVLRDQGIQRGFIVTRKKGSGFDLVLSHRDSVALYRLMYNNAPRIYLKRKYEVFRRAITTLYGDKT